LINIGDGNHSNNKLTTYFLGVKIMKVMVINKDGKPLMPCSCRKARLLLRDKKALIYKREPFTIQLVYGSSGYVQPVTVGVDSGSENLGFSAVNHNQEIIGGELILLKGISERLTERRKYRRTRRNRLRYRSPRFNNRRRKEGWFAPSIEHKLSTHHRLIDLIKSILPVEKVVIEVANFDIQKIKDPSIKGEKYQHGEQYGFDNLREYILHRDGHKCQNPHCNNKAKKTILQVHHLGYWKEDRTDRPANLITLCSQCHTPKNHQPKQLLHGWKPKLKSFKDETFMSTVRWQLTQAGYEHTFGYITKAKRRELNLEKSHHNDAFVIAGGTNQSRCEPLMMEQIRRNKRALEQFYDAKYVDIRDGKLKSGTELFSGRITRNKNLNTENLRKYRGEKKSSGRRAIKRHRYPYKQHDLVLFNNKIYSVIGMQNKGTRVKLVSDDVKVKNLTASIKKVQPIKKRGGICKITA
jgi:hypothetical protein